MSQPFIGEIRLFGGNFAPAGWMFCDGSVLAIAQNTALFQLIGTTYGGDGVTTFALPDLRGRIPMHQGSPAVGTTRILGEAGGVEQVALTLQQIPLHSHPLMATSGVGHLSEPQDALLAAHRDFATFDSATTAPLPAATVTPSGGSQPHANLPPYLCVSFIISLFGIFPPVN